MEKKKQVLFLNTVMMYILTFSGYALALITTPLQTRIFGELMMGVIVVASAYATYVQVFVDFGFILSATEDVAKAKDDPTALSRIMTAVFWCKMGLGAVAYAVFTVICLFVDTARDHLLLFQLYFISTFINALLPDFVYRGLERMTSITVRTVVIKLFFTAGIFLFLRTKEQAYLVPLLNGLGSLGACIWSYIDVKKRLGIGFVKLPFTDVWQTLKRSSGYFFSRIASTVYGATNAVILDFIYPASSPVVGHYGSAEKLINTARSAMSPIADSLYPYMVKNRDFKLVRKFFLLLMPPILLGCTVVGIFAEPLCAWFFGEEFRGSGLYLQLLMPAVVVALPTYILGFPVLSPLGLAKYANRSVTIGAVVHGVVLLGLFLTGTLSAATVCISTCLTECVVLGIRIAVILRQRALTTSSDKSKGGSNE